MRNSHLQGKSYLRQTLVNINRERLCDAHPATYGWQHLRQHPKHDLPVYHLNGVELMRHPNGDCWLVQHLGECYRSELHVSEITRELETIKLKIELELSKREFSANVQKMAA